MFDIKRLKTSAIEATKTILSITIPMLAVAGAFGSLMAVGELSPWLVPPLFIFYAILGTTAFLYLEGGDDD